jgi:hypothetical protein
MVPNGAPLDSGGIRAADNDAHKRTRDRHWRNPHFAQCLQSQDLRNSAWAAASKRDSYLSLRLFAIRANYRPQRLLFCYYQRSCANQYRAGKNPPAI